MSARARHRAVLFVMLAGLSFFVSAGAPNHAVPGLPSSMTRPASASKSADKDGFLQRWLLLEPVAVPIRSNAQLVDSFVQSSIKQDYYSNLFAVFPHDGDKVTVNGRELAWHAVDSKLYQVNLYHFADSLGKQRFNAIFWAVTVVNSPEELKNVRLAVGSNSGSIWWVNGEEVIDLYLDRHMLVDDGVSKRLTLHKGANVVRCAVINGPGLSAFCARFLDNDDKPVKILTQDLNGFGK